MRVIFLFFIFSSLVFCSCQNDRIPEDPFPGKWARCQNPAEFIIINHSDNGNQYSLQRGNETLKLTWMSDKLLWIDKEDKGINYDRVRDYLMINNQENGKTVTYYYCRIED